MRARSFLFVAGALPLLAACSFLLDFDGLQRSAKHSPDAGTDADGSGGASAGDDASAGDEPGADDDATAGDDASAAGARDLARCDDGDLAQPIAQRATAVRPPRRA